MKSKRKSGKYSVNGERVLYPFATPPEIFVLPLVRKRLGPVPARQADTLFANAVYYSNNRQAYASVVLYRDKYIEDCPECDSFTQAEMLNSLNSQCVSGVIAVSESMIQILDRWYEQLGKRTKDRFDEKVKELGKTLCTYAGNITGGKLTDPVGFIKGIPAVSDLLEYDIVLTCAAIVSYEADIMIQRNIPSYVYNFHLQHDAGNADAEKVRRIIDFVGARIVLSEQQRKELSQRVVDVMKSALAEKKNRIAIIGKAVARRIFLNTKFDVRRTALSIACRGYTAAVNGTVIDEDKSLYDQLNFYTDADGFYAFLEKTSMTMAEMVEYSFATALVVFGLYFSAEVREHVLDRIKGMEDMQVTEFLSQETIKAAKEKDDRKMASMTDEQKEKYVTGIFRYKTAGTPEASVAFLRMLNGKLNDKLTAFSSAGSR